MNTLVLTTCFLFLFLNVKTGSTAAITTELESMGDKVADFTISKPGFFPRNENTSIRELQRLMVDEEHPYLSSITMIAPR